MLAFDEPGTDHLRDDLVLHAGNASRWHNRLVSQPQWTPSARELADLELVMIGVIDEAELTVALPSELATADTVELLDPEGLPLARWHGSRRVEPLTLPQFGPFRRFHQSPAEVREQHPDAFAVAVTGPLTIDDVAAIKAHAAQTGATPLLVAMTGPGSPQGLSAPGLVRATVAAAVPGAAVVAVAAAARPDSAFYNRVAAAYADDVMPVSGTGDLPEPVALVRDRDRPPPDRQGLVVFFTGLSGSGKSTLARALHDLILERGERTVTSLDGDVVRHHLSKGLGFSRQDRETNIARIGWVAAEISRHGGVAICSPIAPFDATRQQVRAMVEDAGGEFVLVHVATPLAECERRDRKGLYAKARAGLIPDFTGISSPYEEPADASVRVDTTGRTIQDALGDVLDHLYLNGWICSPDPAPAPEG